MQNSCQGFRAGQEGAVVGIQLNHLFAGLLLYHVALVRDRDDFVVKAADIGLCDFSKAFL